MPNAKLAEWFADADMNDTATVGGKGASLGEMFQKLSGIGVKVPNGFTLTTAAFKQFVEAEIPETTWNNICLLYTSPSPRDDELSRMPSSA